ncbi:MAG: SPOR domain-containing protein, partial [Bacteroidales bacterium]|nr:SPOR domain-containing protein [Bacteroidales bacterium]
LLFTLYKKQTVELTSIGKITMNGNRLQFQSEMGLNLQDENYGLTSFIFPLIQREQIIQPKPVEPIFVNTTSKPPIRKYVGIAASIVVLLGCFTYFLLQQSHSNLNLSRLFPELSWNAPTTTNQPTTIENNNFLPIAPYDFLDSLMTIAAREQQDQSIPEKENQPTIIIDSTLSDFEQKSNDNQNVEQESPTAFEQPQEPVSKKYYIIGASYELRINAEERCNELKASGFQAEVLDAPKIGRFRVSYGCFTSRKESESFLEEVRKNYRPDAWLFIVKQ